MTVKTRVVQRSPDLGLGIKLQRLSDPPKPADPLPPWWWGWFDEDRNRRRQLETLHSNDSTEMYDRVGYWPGVWTATVDGASAVAWVIEFTPMIWLGRRDWQTDAIVDVAAVWEGGPIRWNLPPAKTRLSPEELFTLVSFDLPDSVSYLGRDFGPETYWPDPVAPLPLTIAAGNTLSIVQDSRGISGHLRASAFVNGVQLGDVTHLFKRINIFEDI